MVESLRDYMCRYMREHVEPLEGCLVAAYDSPEHYLSLLDVSLGTTVFSAEIKFCELLTDAGLFREEVQLTRDGRNRYKVFFLTDLGKAMAQQIKAEGYSGAVPQSTPLYNV